ncbi:MAG: hypothetical protein FWD57_03245 [Polyangiaceae bacterium]|nr:hypothetical protein [Polyangiaceae bacterium]
MTVDVHGGSDGVVDPKGSANTGRQSGTGSSKGDGSSETTPNDPALIAANPGDPGTPDSGIATVDGPGTRAVPFTGCGPFPPIKSQDKCQTASDCAPASPCHARSCVAVANANPPQANTVCTMNLVCPSIDIGKCDCVDGLCALVFR